MIYRPLQSNIAKTTFANRNLSWKQQMADWFTLDKIDDTTYIISEYRRPEETHCCLLIGRKRCLLIDTGLGIGNIYAQVRKLTDKPVTAIATPHEARVAE